MREQFQDVDFTVYLFHFFKLSNFYSGPLRKTFAEKLLHRHPGTLISG